MKKLIIILAYNEAGNIVNTIDNVIKYVVIACVSLVLITLGIIIYIKKIIKSE